MAVLYNSVHFTLLILLLRAKVDDQISWARVSRVEIDNSNNNLKFLLPSEHMMLK